MAYTIKDVAKEAGVSTATVSKVINNKMYVSAVTRDKVLQVMKRLNYTPNASAANLARGSSKTILYADSFYKGLPYQNPHMFDIICGVSNELSRKGYHLSLLNLDSCGRKAKDIFEDAIQSQVADGIILNGVYASPQVERLMLRYDFPQICIGKPEFDTILSWIDTNNTLSSNLAVEHLISCGCKRIAFMGGREEDKIFMDRLRGFRTAMEMYNMPVREEHITYNDPDINAVYHSAIKLLEDAEPPDGIICANGMMTVGTMRAIEEKGMAIPEKIKLIAFDNYPYSPVLSIPPTVIDIDLFSLGTHAGNLLLKKIKNPAMLIQTYTALPRLLQRGTTLSAEKNGNF